MNFHQIVPKLKQYKKHTKTIINHLKKANLLIIKLILTTNNQQTEI